MMSGPEALQRLRAGNLRFVDENHHRSTWTSHTRRKELVSGQAPFAIILGCSDSRVPAEIVFDQGLGDLFVIRVAGNVVAPSLLGSVEFAAEHFGTHLVVVLGHSKCGAVTATVDELERPSESRSPNLHAIVDRIRPVVQPLIEADRAGDRDTLIERAVRANIGASVSQIRHGSRILEDLIEGDDLLVVGAQYALETGVVEFLEEP